MGEIPASDANEASHDDAARLPLRLPPTVDIEKWLKVRGHIKFDTGLSTSCSHSKNKGMLGRTLLSQSLKKQSSETTLYRNPTSKMRVPQSEFALM